MNIIFDMDGVILDSEQIYMDGYLYAAKVYGLPEKETRESVLRCTGCTEEMEREIMEEAFGTHPDFCFDDVFRSSREYFSRIAESGRISLKPGAEEILAYLKKREIPVGLASSSPLTLIRQELGSAKVLSYFDVIVSGDMVSRSKPDPEIFLKCAKRLGISSSVFHDTYVIEDSYNGIQAAYAAGMKPVMIPDLLMPTEEMREKSALILPSLFELRDWAESRL